MSHDCAAVNRSVTPHFYDHVSIPGRGIMKVERVVGFYSRTACSSSGYFPPFLKIKASRIS
jgi:hypothetical protein